LASTNAETGTRIAPALATSALIGFALGLCFPAWHVAIEPAQVAAGLVSYPADNPYALYEMRVWNVWHQLLTPLLVAGVPERTLTFALSGVVGAINFAALCLFALAMGASPPLALAAPLLTWFFNPLVMQWGFNYPILLVGQGHTYGMVGLAWLALACGALGAGRLASGAFLIGVAPAFHASLGAWLALIAGIAGLTMFARLRPHLGALLRGGGLGVAVAAASFAAHQIGRAPEPSIDPALAQRYLDTFVHLWDAHRVPPELHWNFALLLTATLLAASIAIRRRRELDVGRALALRIFVGTACLGLALAAVLYLVPERALPDALLIAMPTRMLNFPVLLYVPLVLGVAWAMRGDPIARGVLAVLAVAAVAWPAADWLQTVVLPGLGLATTFLVWRGERARALPRLDPTLRAVLVLGIGIGIVLEVPVALRGRPRRAAAVRAPATDAALAAASQVEGLIAVAPGVNTAQAATRRPIVLDPGALDMLPYALAGAPQVERILGDLYGIDFFNPPGSAIRQGVVPYGMAKKIWESRAPVGWHATASRIGFTHVLVPSLWKIDLPLVAKSDVYALYRVPPPEAVGPAGSQ
jgi:hypothetical protein